MTTLSPVVVLTVVSRYHPGTDLSFADAPDGVPPLLSLEDERNDGWDTFNHPRYRRAMILRELATHCGFEDDTYGDGKGGAKRIAFVTPSAPNDVTANLKDTAYQKAHSIELLDFLSTSWTRWDALGHEGQDPASSLKFNLALNEVDCIEMTKPLIPGNFPMPRDTGTVQRPSQNVMGQVGYYCTDTCTPIFSELLTELWWDLETIQLAVKLSCLDNGDDVVVSSTSASSLCCNVVYALCTHPGHHAGYDSFGGYCYVNHAALSARLLQEYGKNKVAILDVDYHCGNGSANIFYDDPTVLVVSIHCHPDWDYPFHSGYEDESGIGDGKGTTMHMPLLPGTTWKDSYRATLEKAMTEIVHNFRADALVVSLGLDTHAGDPCAIRRAGFLLQGDDYLEMGTCIGEALKRANDRSSSYTPVVVIQEGGYKMDNVPKAATDVLLGLADAVKR